MSHSERENEIVGDIIKLWENGNLWNSYLPLILKENFTETPQKFYMKTKLTNLIILTFETAEI